MQGKPDHSFASDNWAGMCPEAAQALQEANAGHAPSYGNDRWTAEATRLMQTLFETNCSVYFVFNGTAANSLSLASLCAPFESVLCHEFAHIATDECGAPGFFSHGTTLTPLPGANGKLEVRTVESAIRRRTDVHAPKPKALSITQSTELGTVYQLDECAALSDLIHHCGMSIHMDGARFANAIASLNIPPREIWKAGIDVLSFGGAKNGLPFGEAVVFFNETLARNFEFRRKQAGQLGSKMRFLAAPWIGILRNDVWLRNAKHANAMAAQMAAGLRKIPGIEILYGCEANAVFASMPLKITEGLLNRGWDFYCDVGPDGAARLMCSWDTTSDDIERFIQDALALAK